MLRSRISPWIALAATALAVAGCAPVAGGGAMAIGLFVTLLGLLVGACSASHEPGGDASVDAGGHWEACCVGTEIRSCHCPEGYACNYGWFDRCDDGSCRPMPGACPGAQDGGPDDGGWVDPDGGWVDPDGGWVDPDGGWVDGGAVDAGEPGNWEPCCADGRIELCFCPEFLACNYGWFEDCGDGTCVAPGAGCRE